MNASRRPSRPKPRPTCGEGAECLREYVIEPAKWREAFPEWGDWTVIGILESCSYSRPLARALASRVPAPFGVTKDDMRPVRTVDDVLVFQTVTNGSLRPASLTGWGNCFPGRRLTAKAWN